MNKTTHFTISQVTFYCPYCEEFQMIDGLDIQVEDGIFTKCDNCREEVSSNDMTF